MKRTMLAVTISALIAGGCAPGQDPKSVKGESKTRETETDHGRITIDGSSTVFIVTQQVAEGYMDAHPETQVNVSFSGTGSGFKKFAAGDTDISDASRPIEDKEIKALEAAKIEFIEVPVAYDGLTVVVSKENTWIENLTVAELKKIWEPASKGTVTKWSQIRAGWPDTEIQLYGPGTGSGTFDFFTKVIVGKEGSSRPDYTPSEDDNQLVIGVAGDKGALGYLGFAYYLENQDKLKAVAIDNGKGPVAPSAETIENGTYAPLSRPEFIYIKKSSLEKPHVKAFVDYYIGPAGQALIKESGFAPFKPQVYDLIKARVEAGKTGTLFGGKMGVSVEEVYK